MIVIGIREEYVIVDDVFGGIGVLNGVGVGVWIDCDWGGSGGGWGGFGGVGSVLSDYRGGSCGCGCYV